MKKAVLHEYPPRGTESTERRDHDLDNHEECWCKPQLLKWGPRPDGRQGWVRYDGQGLD